MTGKAGLFDSVRTAADDEFYQRLRHVFGAAGFVHIPHALYSAPVRAESLSAGNEVSLQIEEQADPLSHLSADRRAYYSEFTKWHESGRDPYMQFPQRVRPFPAPAALLPTAHEDLDFISASMATFPPRRDLFRTVVRAMLPQVDQLNIYLNDYERVPDFLHHPKIRIARSQDHGDLRDNGKFFFASDLPSGYHFTIDDDIHYPPDYVAYTIAKLRQYDNAAVVGYHGRIFPEVITRFFDQTTTRAITFRRLLRSDEPVHVLGTGTVAYHTSLMDIELSDFASLGMADVWFAAYAQERGVPLVAAARAAGFLRPMQTEESSLFDEFAERDHEHTEIVKRLEPWSFPPVGGACRP